ncbi:hypothetical protein Syun_014085 [Stephania yunnanensis]|uniref:Polygalacturonase n=1 Tax=Stephania yunnanensis TaxID=152371 RepID=A0AAP0PBG2_9MAGN
MAQIANSGFVRIRCAKEREEQAQKSIGVTARKFDLCHVSSQGHMRDPLVEIPELALESASYTWMMRYILAISTYVLGNIVAPKMKDPSWRALGKNKYWIQFSYVDGLIVTGTGKFNGRGQEWVTKIASALNTLGIQHNKYNIYLGHRASVTTSISLRGGSGYARDIMFEDITFNSVKNPIIINQYYSDYAYASQDAVIVSNITYRRLYGTCSTKDAIVLKCSNVAPCTGITMDNVVIKTEGCHATCINAQGKATATTPLVTCLKGSEVNDHKGSRHIANGLNPVKSRGFHKSQKFITEINLTLLRKEAFEGHIMFTDYMYCGVNTVVLYAGLRSDCEASRSHVSHVPPLSFSTKPQDLTISPSCTGTVARYKEPGGMELESSRKSKRIFEVCSEAGPTRDLLSEVLREEMIESPLVDDDLNKDKEEIDEELKPNYMLDLHDCTTNEEEAKKEIEVEHIQERSDEPYEESKVDKTLMLMDPPHVSCIFRI